MKIFFLLLFLSVAFAFRAPVVHAETVETLKREVKVTYIANAGFLIQVNDKKVLIDALFENIKSEHYDSPSKELTRSIIAGEGIFSGIDLVAVTHGHVDNFDEKITTSFLENHPSAKVVSCSPTVKLLEKNAQYKNVKDQIVEITPARLSYADTIINDIEIRVIGLNHGPYYIEDPLTGRKTDIYKFAEHVGFLIKIDGVSIFHCGDSNSNALEEYKHFKLNEQHLDFAFLGRGFLYQPKGQGVDIMKKYIQAQHFVIMEIQHEDNEYFINVANAVKAELPSVKIFEKEGETKTYLCEPNLLTVRAK
jgi:L-ascorbate metabolism protein UlaG (beta-lactamase superfamily)